MIKSAVSFNETKPPPDGWQSVRLGDISKANTIQVLPNTAEATRLPYVGLEHVESETGRITGVLSGKNNASVQGTAFRFDSRHVLYGKLRPYLNKVALPDFEGRCSTELLPLLPSEECDKTYLALLLRRSETVTEAMRHMTGTRMPRADMDELSRLLVPLPPLPEQKRIVAKVQKLLEDVERARTACEARLEAAKTLPKAYLRQVFESEEAKKWERRRLGEIAVEFVNGGTPSTVVTQYWGGDIPWITGADVTNLWVSRGRKFITKEGLNNSATHLVDKGTILIVTRTGVGKVSIAANALCFSQDITGVICSIQVLPEYLARFLIFHQDQLVQIQRGATIKGLARRDIESMEISLPSVSEQNHIVAELKHKLTSTEKLKTDIEKQLETIKALPQATLRKAFRGEL